MRTYLDYNATAPLRPEARNAMIAAMDLCGNPSSVHAEGRVAKGLVERARGQIAEALGASGADIVFVSGATEAAALILSGRGLKGAAIEHDAVRCWIEQDLSVDQRGLVSVLDPPRSVLQLANSETGILQNLPKELAVSDISQGFGRVPFAFSWSGVEAVFLAAHKCGGPKGIGALVFPQGFDLAAQLKGGGQEMGRRAGTENVAAIVGIGAAAQAAIRDLNEGVWDRVAELRIILEKAIEATSQDTTLVGKDTPRLPNTVCALTPAWKGESQVMAMDLAGYAVSAGSACSSGKVRASATLMAMGFSEAEAASAIRISLGPETTQAEVLGFAQVWADKREKQRRRAA